VAEPDIQMLLTIPAMVLEHKEIVEDIIILDLLMVLAVVAEPAQLAAMALQQVAPVESEYNLQLTEQQLIMLAAAVVVLGIPHSALVVMEEEVAIVLALMVWAAAEAGHIEEDPEWLLLSTLILKNRFLAIGFVD
jgi:hypothetical protein